MEYNMRQKPFDEDHNTGDIKIPVDADVESVRTVSVAFAHPAPTRSKRVCFIKIIGGLFQTY